MHRINSTVRWIRRYAGFDGTLDSTVRWKSDDQSQRKYRIVQLLSIHRFWNEIQMNRNCFVMFTRSSWKKK